MTEEEKGGVQGSSLEELGQKVDAFEGYMREYREAKRSNKTIKIVVVVVIVAVAIFYAAMFLYDIRRVIRTVEDMREDPQLAQSLEEGLASMWPSVQNQLEMSIKRLRPQLEEEVKKAAEEARAEIEEALKREVEALYDRVGTELQPHLQLAATDILERIMDVELQVLYENIHAKLSEELTRAGARLIPQIQASLEEQANILSESLSAELSYRMHQEFDGLLQYYLDKIEKEFPEITDENRLAQMAANLQVAFAEAAKDVIEKRLKDHKEALLDIAETMEDFKADEKATDAELWREVKQDFLLLLQIKLATGMIEVETEE